MFRHYAWHIVLKIKKFSKNVRTCRSIFDVVWVQSERSESFVVPCGTQSRQSNKEKAPKDCQTVFCHLHGVPVFYQISRKMNFEGILRRHIGNTGFYWRKWSLSDTCGPEKPHKIIVGSFKNTVSTTFQKVASERGPELHFGCFWAPQIRQNSKKCSPKRNQKNDFVSGAH